MKYLIIPFILSLSLAIIGQTPQLHVEGDARIDPLAGPGNRIVYADSQGTLIAGANIGSSTISVNTHNDLINLNPTDSAVVILEGFYASGDGGGGIFYYNPLSTLADNVGTVVRPASVTTVGRWLRLFQDEMNVKWFGAKGDNLHDDTQAIQAAIDAVPSHPLLITNVAGTVNFPVGYYKITNSLNLIDNATNKWRRNINLKGKSNGSGNAIGSNLIYYGDDDVPMINLFSRNCLIEGLTFYTAQDISITTAILIENPQGVGVVPCSGNTFKNLVISGNRTLPVNYQYGSIMNGVTVGGEVFGNKELMKFHNCQFEYLEGAGFLVDNYDGQSKAHSFYDCGFIFSRYGIKILSGSFQTYSSSFGRLDTAIILNQIADNIVINDTDSELCDAFLVTIGNSNGYWPVSITAGRFALSQSISDPYISFYHSGPFTLQNCVFEPQYNPNFRMEWGTPGGQNERIASVFNSFGNGFPNDNPYAPDANSLWRLNAIGNVGYEEANSPVTLVDEFRANAAGFGDLNLTTLSGISSTATPAKNVRGRFRLVDTLTSVEVEFDEPEIDNDYYLAITQVEFLTGSGFAAVGGGVTKKVTKTTTGFTVEFYEAIGLGSEGFYDWILVR